MALAALLGEKLLSKDGEVDTTSALAGKGAVALYFSGHWCPPCRGFTPQLAEWYTKDLKAKGLEVIFVSSDKSEGEFKEYFGEQPWLALPYDKRDVKEQLSSKYKVQGIPSVVILDAEGNIITKDGRAALSSDPKGEEFPWKPKTVAELLAGAKLIGKGGAAVGPEAIDGKVLALYFSGHWCPPCRGFTPQLAKWYTDGLKDKGLEVIFVSSDKSEDEFKEYFGEQPWLALDYSDRKLKEQLSSAFGVSGIPSVVILDKDRSVINKEGRDAISGDPTGATFPWHEKAVKNMKDGPGCLNEVPTVIAFVESMDGDAQKAVEEAMKPLAQKYIDEAKATDEDPKFGFMVETGGSGVAKQIRSMAGLPAMPLKKHEHLLKEKTDSTGGWGCDGCGKNGAGGKRFRCPEGCDFDFCGECNEKAGADPELPPNCLMLTVVSDGMSYYTAPDGPITAASIESFVAAYSAGTLEQKKLQR